MMFPKTQSLITQTLNKTVITLQGFLKTRPLGILVYRNRRL